MENTPTTQERIDQEKRYWEAIEEQVATTGVEVNAEGTVVRAAQGVVSPAVLQVIKRRHRPVGQDSTVDDAPEAQHGTEGRKGPAIAAVCSAHAFVVILQRQLERSDTDHRKAS